MPQDKTQRYIAGQVMLPLGSLMAHVTHELYRVAHHQRDGLSDKEYEYLMALHRAQEQLMVRSGKLRERLRKSA